MLLCLLFYVPAALCFFLCCPIVSVFSAIYFANIISALLFSSSLPSSNSISSSIFQHHHTIFWASLLFPTFWSELLFCFCSLLLFFLAVLLGFCRLSSLYPKLYVILYRFCVAFALFFLCRQYVLAHASFGCLIRQ